MMQKFENSVHQTSERHHLFLANDNQPEEVMEIYEESE